MKLRLTLFFLLLVLSLLSFAQTPSSTITDTIFYSVTSKSDSTERGISNSGFVDIKFPFSPLDLFDFDSIPPPNRRIKIYYEYEMDSNCQILGLKTLKKNYGGINYEHLERKMLSKLKLAVHIVTYNGLRQPNCSKLNNINSTTPAKRLLILKIY